MQDCLNKDLEKGDIVLYHVTDGYWATTYFGVITGERTKGGKARILTANGKSFGTRHQFIKVNEELVTLHLEEYLADKIIEKSRVLKAEL